jgi:hypothetical protein
MARRGGVAGRSALAPGSQRESGSGSEESETTDDAMDARGNDDGHETVSDRARCVRERRGWRLADDDDVDAAGAAPAAASVKSMTRASHALSSGPEP